MTVIDEYLQHVDHPQRKALERIRAIVHAHVPEAKETIGYGIPVMRYKDKYLIGFANFKNHMSLFPGASPIAVLDEQLRPFKLSKGTIQFTIENQLPEPLLIDIIAGCVEAVRQGR